MLKKLVLSCACFFISTNIAGEVRNSLMLSCKKMRHCGSESGDKIVTQLTVQL